MLLLNFTKSKPKKNSRRRGKMTEQEKQAVEELTRSFAMEMFYKVKCTEVEARKEEIDRLESETPLCARGSRRRWS